MGSCHLEDPQSVQLHIEDVSIARGSDENRPPPRERAEDSRGRRTALRSQSSTTPSEIRSRGRRRTQTLRTGCTILLFQETPWARIQPSFAFSRKMLTSPGLLVRRPSDLLTPRQKSNDRPRKRDGAPSERSMFSIWRSARTQQTSMRHKAVRSSALSDNANERE